MKAPSLETKWPCNTLNRQWQTCVDCAGFVHAEAAKQLSKCTPNTGWVADVHKCRRTANRVDSAPKEAFDQLLGRWRERRDSLRRYCPISVSNLPNEVPGYFSLCTLVFTATGDPDFFCTTSHSVSGSFSSQPVFWGCATYLRQVARAGLSGIFCLVYRLGLDCGIKFCQDRSSLGLEINPGQTQKANDC